MSSSTKPTKQGRKFPGGHYWSGGADIDMKGANLKRGKKALVVSTNSVIQCLHMHHHLMIMSNFIHTHAQSIVCEQSEEKRKKWISSPTTQVLLSNTRMQPHVRGHVIFKFKVLWAPSLTKSNLNLLHPNGHTERSGVWCGVLSTQMLWSAAPLLQYCCTAGMQRSKVSSVSIMCSIIPNLCNSP